MEIGTSLASLGNSTLGGLIRTDDGGHLHVDLADARFCEPSGLVLVAAMVDKAFTSGWDIDFTRPRSHQVAMYIDRMGMSDLLERAGVSHGLPRVNRYAAQRRFVELGRFGPDEDVEDIVDGLDVRMQKWGNDTLRSQLYNMFFELGINIDEHAERPGYIAGQHYPALNRYKYAIADWGIGIPGSLGRAGHVFDDDRAAIVAAATTRLTSKAKDGGFGLKSVVTDMTRPRGGVVRIISGDGHVRFGHDRSVVERTCRLDYPGTLVSVEFPC